MNAKLHIVIAKLQGLMNRSAHRKARYIQHLNDQGCKNVRSMPTMVLCRWNSWFEVIEYLVEFLPDIRNFLDKEQKEQDSSELVNALMEILTDTVQ